MKKVLLTAMAIVTLASASAFGMYGRGDSWIDFLVHGNQFRARMDQIGFTLGNDTIKGTFGFRANAINLGNLGNILSGNTGDVTLDSTLSAGIGYTSDAFGIGVGYNFTYVNKGIQVHTPVLMVNALNDNLRIVVPIQVAVSDDLDANSAGAASIHRTDYLGLSTDIQIRYYTGIDAFNAIRLYVNYGQAGYKVGNLEYANSSLGLQLRLYFLNTTIGNVNVNPYIRLEYETALEGNQLGIKSSSLSYEASSSQYVAPSIKGASYDYKAYKFKIMPVLGLGANSDIVSVWFEPSIGYQVSGSGNKNDKLSHSLAWGAYAELYITPVQDLEWYFEMDVNNTGRDGTTLQGATPVYFETSTGITWYLPSLGGDQ
ncbi:variable surface family protein [Brachyspira sp. G79]|uniref:variable surface family protein n=1 Tax=Brachyspira sp. G79 TaxID=1358104 RepID=UPI000BBBAEB7|nr:variable surface family protein [Brachyspira sp. G79]PCG20473.1 cell surface protein [Brachyspira sp. G79]